MLVMSSPISFQRSTFVQTWTHCEIKFLPFIKPDFSDAGSILEHNICNTTRKRIRTFITKNMSHMWTWSDLQNSTTLPYLNRRSDFQLKIIGLYASVKTILNKKRKENTWSGNVTHSEAHFQVFTSPNIHSYNTKKSYCFSNKFPIKLLFIPSS